MNFKLISLLLFSLSASVFFSACAGAESKVAEEVVIDNGANSPNREVIITSADIKDDRPEISMTTEGGNLGKKVLTDQSFIETIIDGFGNRIETRYFPEQSRLRMLILRTSSDGKHEVTVYGKGGDTKIVAELKANALTASSEEIARIANLSSTPTYTTNQRNFMKGGRSDTQTPLQPLPSSAFQSPLPQDVQPVGNTPSENSDDGETDPNRQTNPDED